MVSPVPWSLNPMVKRWSLWSIGLCAAGALAWALMSVGGLQAAVDKFKRTETSDRKGQAPVLEFLPAETVSAQWRSMPLRLEFSGTLSAPVAATVRAKAVGTLVQLDVAEGARVRAGQVIGRIDAAEAASRSTERAAALESARAGLVQAERTHAQNESLAEQRFIAASALEGSRAALNAARAQVAAAEAALNTARLSVSEASVVAPVAGLVSKRHALAGEKVNLEQSLVSIIDIRELELLAQVGLHDVGRLFPGMAVRVTVEGMPEAVAGRITRIAPSAEPGSRAIAVVVAVPNAQERLRAGQYGVVQVDVADATRRLTLPESAVFTSSGGSEAWELTEGVLKRRALTLGRRDAATARVEVLSGLSPEATVLAARFENLRDGAQATVVTARAAAAPPSSASSAAR